jgi:hypothetical protein
MVKGPLKTRRSRVFTQSGPKAATCNSDRASSLAECAILQLAITVDAIMTQVPDGQWKG